MSVRKAVIPAAGFGTRFLPATKAQPKEMLPLVDTPIIQYVVEEAVAAGIEDILIITGRGKRTLEDHFDRSVELEYFLRQNAKEGLLASIRDLSNQAQIHFVRQKEQLGLGHAIYQARQHVGNEPFAVLLGDEVFVGEQPCLGQLMEVHEKTGGSVVGIQTVPMEDVPRYGIVAGDLIEDRLYRLTDLIEKPAVWEAPSNQAIIGRYILSPDIFPILGGLSPGRNNEVQLTDALRELRSTSPIFALDPKTRRYDVGEKLGFLKATVELALARDDIGPAFREYLDALMRLPQGSSAV